MFVGKKYRPEKINGSFDAIVIGSGIGGLTLAALLSKAGRRVLVLERHYTAGGFTHSFSRHGYEWDVGVHYIGDVMRPTALPRRLFDFISEGRLKWADIGEVYDRVDIGDGFVDFHAGKAAFKDGLLRHFPQASSDIDRYLARLKAAEKDVSRIAAPRFLPGRLGSLIAPLARLTGRGDFGRTTQEVMQEITRDARLAAVLTGQWGDYGLPPGQSAFGIHALVARHYLYGAAFPVGGASAIARSIVPTIDAAGGLVAVRAEVARVMIEGGRAVGVRMADGVEFRAPRIISACGIDTTAEKLLTAEEGQRVFSQRGRVEPSVGHLGLYLGFKGTAAELGLEKANLWLHAGPDHDANLARHLADEREPFPFVYISFPSAKDPTWDARFPGRSTIDMITVAPYARFTAWADTPWRKRGRDYLDYKERLSQRLIEILFAQLPQLRGKIDHYELSTPLSTQTFVNHGAGQVYGLAHTPQRFAQTWLRPGTALEGFYLTGQDVMTCGVAGAMLGGVATFSHVAGLGGMKVLAQVFR